MKSRLQKIIIVLSLSVFSQVTVAEEKDVPPIKRYLQESDWVQISSGEWLQGDIITMTYGSLEFDSDKLDEQEIDWDDIVELRSSSELSARMSNGDIWDGYLVIKEGKLYLIRYGVVTTLELDDVISLTAYKENEIDLWSGYAKLGATLRRGNTDLFDYTVTAGLQRRSTDGRFKIDYTGHYSNYKDEDTKELIVSADNRRLVSYYDWFINNKFFFRALDFEAFRDPFLNIDKRASYGVALGYFLFDHNTTRWDLVFGPTYQVTKFVAVSEGDQVEKSPGLSLTTDYFLELTKKIDFDMQYQVQWVNEVSGDFIHHFEAGVEVELIGEFELDLTFYLDRTKSPTLGADNIMPVQNDYRLVLGLGYNF